MEVRAEVGAGVRVRLDGGEACVQLRGLRSLRHPSRLSLASRLRRRLRRGQLLQLQLRTQAEPLVARRDLNLEHLGRWRGGGGEVVGRWQEMERSGRREPLSTTSPPPPHHLSITSPPPLHPHHLPTSQAPRAAPRRASRSPARAAGASCPSAAAAPRAGWPAAPRTRARPSPAAAPRRPRPWPAQGVGVRVRVRVRVKVGVRVRLGLGLGLGSGLEPRP